jgi:lipopolysaccharide biosynthesis glycosyltransferase
VKQRTDTKKAPFPNGAFYYIPNDISSQIRRECFEKWPLSGHYSCAMYYRLIAPLVLNGSVERCLYLDADIICLKGIAGLQDIELRDNVAAVISDRKGYIAGF